jgi:hypothetical protein
MEPEQDKLLAPETRGPQSYDHCYQQLPPDYPLNAHLIIHELQKREIFY